MLILSLVCLGNGYASGRISYRQASTYRRCHTYYVTVLVFVCLYVRKTLAVASTAIYIEAISIKPRLILMDSLV